MAEEHREEVFDKRNAGFLAAEAVVLSAAAFLSYKILGIDQALMVLALPFQGLGKLLRWLALGSDLGNTAALLIFLMAGGVPLAILAAGRAGVQSAGFMWLFPVGASALFWMNLYFGVNPALLAGKAGMTSQMAENTAAFSDVVQVILSGAFLSVLAAWFLCAELLRLQKQQEVSRRSAVRRMRQLCFAAAALQTGLLAWIGVYEACNAFDLVLGGGLDGVGTALKLIFLFLPEIFTVQLLLAGTKLLRRFETETFSRETQDALEHLADVSRRVAWISVCCGVFYNMTALLFAFVSANTNLRIEIPILPILAAFGFLLMVRYLQAGRELKEENEGFI